MTQLLDSLPLLAAPFVACLMITVLHGYVGLHVIKRGVIFVDLALAQAAALGAAVALFISPYVGVEGHHQHAAAAPAVITEAQLADQLAAGNAPFTAEHAGRKAVPEHEHPELRQEQLEHATLAYGMSLAFALLAAVLLAFSRFSDERIPHEAIIGIIFVVCAALSVLILSKAPHGHEKMAAMLVGSILFVRWSDVLVMAPLYLALGVFHLALRGPFIRISKGVAAAEAAGVRVRLWDCLFYGAFALLVTHSVSVAGVFVVFSYLIIPPACATLFVNGFGRQMVLAWLIGVTTTVVGLVLSAVGDLPTGPSLVSCFGAALVISVAFRTWFKRRIQPTGVV